MEEISQFSVLTMYNKSLFFSSHFKRIHMFITIQLKAMFFSSCNGQSSDYSKSVSFFMSDKAPFTTDQIFVDISCAICFLPCKLGFFLRNISFKIHLSKIPNLHNQETFGT